MPAASAAQANQYDSEGPAAFPAELLFLAAFNIQVRTPGSPPKAIPVFRLLPYPRPREDLSSRVRSRAWAREETPSLW
jgi:hypothetical protein